MRIETISRRRFFGLLGGVVAAKIAPPIYVLPPVIGWRRPSVELITPFEFQIPQDIFAYYRYLTWQAEMLYGFPTLVISQELPLEEAKRRFLYAVHSPWRRQLYGPNLDPRILADAVNR